MSDHLRLIIHPSMLTPDMLINATICHEGTAIIFSSPGSWLYLILLLASDVAAIHICTNLCNSDYLPSVLNELQ